MPEHNRIVALEEHFWIPELRDRYSGPRGISAHTPARQLDDLGAIRLQDMDAAGISMQVISHMQPGTQIFDAETATALARKANDALHSAIRSHPRRFAGFAELPTVDPEAAADELERTVVKLGFKGALINGLTAGAFLDEKRFWCIFERAQALDVPLYFHPGIPHPAVTQAYYGEYRRGDFPYLSVVWGFTAETALQAIRLIVGGVCDAYPKLKIILGHLGETIPFTLWRCDWLAEHVGGRSAFADTFREHFYVTTSGNFQHSALTCAIAELGIDRIMFAVDYPYNANEQGVAFVQSAPMEDAEKTKILHANADRLLRLAG
ncbi:MAG TPA: amidohydrolase family protein [Steroidobacteraceae bacterium]|nr:amidohydrolase family protein [Steroidobacteraceae bacterium]